MKRGDEMKNYKNLSNMELSDEIKRVEKYLDKLNVERRKRKRDADSKLIVTLEELYDAGNNEIS